MARIRSIKPEFPQSESMGRISRDGRLLFIMLWTIADDSGRLRGNSRMLASLLFPYDDDAKGLMDGWLAELQAEGCIDCYKVDGDSYIEIRNWLIHQKIDKPSKSKIPAFDESSRILANPREASSGDLRKGSKDQGEDQGSSPSDLSSAGAEDDRPSNQPTELVPFQAVVDLYNQTCGDIFPEVLKITDARRKAIKARWNFDTKNERESQRTNSLDYWRRYFTCCRTKIEFFRKAAAGENRGEHAGWVPGFDYLMRETTLLGVLEGKYK